MGTLRLTSGHNVYMLPDGEHVIGRASACDLVLDDTSVSRRHAILRVAGGVASVEDAGSRNAVLVNGRVVRGTRILSPGDEIRLGEQVLLVSEARGYDEETDVGRANIVRVITHMPKRDSGVQTLPSISLSDLLADALRDSRAADAEWLLGRILAQLHYRAAGGQDVDPDTLDSLALQVCRIVEITGEPSWLNGLFDLMAQALRVPPTAFVERLEHLFEVLPEARGGRLSAYVERLRQHAAGLSTVDRLHIERLASLLDRK